MKKIIFLLPLFLFLLAPEVNAQALVTIKEDGQVYKNVLGESIDNTQSSVKKIVGEVVNKIANIVISKVDAKVQIALNGDTGNNANIFDVSGAPVIEIENKSPSKKILIKKIDDNFGIQEEGVTALTSFNVKIDPKTKDLSLFTGTGERSLGVLPSDALNILVSSHIITLIDASPIKISETDKGELVYTISGSKNINFFNIATINIPVISTVSATNGNVEAVDEPKLLKIFGFLFS